MKIQAYIYHKRAEKYSDCQDYFGIDTQNNRIAVSDGMSQSIYPQWWAKILVDAYLANGRIPTSAEELQRYQVDWQEKVKDEITKRETAGINPWRLKNAVAEKSGAGATLCGFTWNPDINRWSCECIGDSSLIVIYRDYAIKIRSSQEGKFDNYPDYLDSYRNGRGSVKKFDDSFENVMAILIVTDPFSELFQKHIADKEFIKARFKEFLALSDHKSYCELIERWRDNLDMHNDDSTLIILRDFSEGESVLDHIDSLEKLCTDEKNVNVAKKNQSNESSNAKIVYEQPDTISDKGCDSETSQPTISSLSEEENNKEFLRSSKKALKTFKGKRSRKRVKRFFKKLLSPIINDFCKK